MKNSHGVTGIQEDVLLCQFLPGGLHPPLHPHVPAHELHLDSWLNQPLTSQNLNWPYTSDTNHLAHSLTGNKRRLGYKLSLWNCRRKLLDQSNRDTNKFIDIKNFVEKNKPHVLSIIESDLFSTSSQSQRRFKLTSEEVTERLKIEGYKLVLPDTWEAFGQARVLAFVSDEVFYKRKTQSQATLDLPNITLEIGLGKEKKTLVNIFYREWTSGFSGISDHASQVDRLSRQIDYWKTLNRLKKDVIIMGDANLDAKRWNNPDYNANLKILGNLVQEYLLEESSYQLVKDFTRSEMTNNVVHSSCIDHIYTNSPTKCDNPRVEAIGDSDHLGITLVKYSKEILNKPQAVLKRNYKNFDVGSFLIDIQNSNINIDVLACEDIDSAASVFQERFLEILNHHAPIKIFQTRKHYVPFLTEETKKLMEERDALKKVATENQDEILFKEFRIKRNEVKKRLPIDEENYHKNKFHDPNIDVRKAWKCVYNALGVVKNNSPSKLDFNDKIITNPKQLATAFNKIFKNKVKKLREKINNDPKVDPCERLESWLSQRSEPLREFQLQPIGIQKLRKIMKKMKNSRSHGRDFIDGCSLKLAFPLIEESILHLVNLSIKGGEFAEKWKIQLILPLHKKNDKLNGNNYRPVSHIIEIGKIAEYAVHEQVYNHFSSNNIFHGNHHGFLGNCSTATALSQLYDIWLTAAEKRELSAALLLDLSAAFDIVDHQIFLRKLESYGFSANSVKWFSSYLSGRSQTVQVETKFSDPEAIGDYGVPQGSILGPLIFIIFSNDFPASSVEGEAVLYADDDTENVSDADPEELKGKIQREANKATDWVSDNKMVCAGDKTKLLIIGTSQLKKSKLSNLPDLEIEVCGNRVKESKSEKLLGLVVNNKLSWSDYIHGENWRDEGNFQGLLPQLSQRVGLLHQVVHLMPRERFRQISNGLFHSKLIYCLQVFGNVWGINNYDETNRRFAAFTKSDNQKLQVLQNKVLRMLTGANFDVSTQSLLNMNNSLSVQQLTAFTTLISAQKAIYHQKPEYFSRKLVLNSSSQENLVPHRWVNNLQVQADLTISRGGFFHRAAILWNLLPEGMKQRMEPDKFKKKAKDWVKRSILVKPP